MTFGRTRRRRRGTLAAIVTAVAVAAFAVAGAGDIGAATVDVPGRFVYETSTAFATPPDPDRCLIQWFLEFNPIEGGSTYTAVLADAWFGGEKTFQAAPPYPGDSVSWYGGGVTITFTAPPGTHRIPLHGLSTPEGCSEALADTEGRWSIVSLTTEVSNPPPVASFAWAVSPGDSSTIDFDASASTDDESIASYDWDFGDGGSGSGETTSHTFAAGGSYAVELLVTDNEGATDTVTIVVDVEANDPPTASFTWRASDSDPLTIEFDGSGSTDDEGIVSYEWDFGDGESATGPTPEPHHYDEAGTYPVTLTVTDAGELMDTDAQDVDVAVCRSDPEPAAPQAATAVEAAAVWNTSFDFDVLNADGQGVRGVVVEIRDNCGSTTITEPTGRDGRTSITLTVPGPRQLTLKPLAPDPVVFAPSAEVELLDAGGGEHYSAHEFRTAHTCLSRPVTVLGSGGGDEIELFSNDVVDAFGGSDTIGAAMDEPSVVVCGGAGEDRVEVAGTGSDRIDGGPDGDSIFVAGGDDFVIAGDGANFVFAGPGNDVVYGGADVDTVRGGSGCDGIHGGDGNDVLDGDRDPDGPVACPGGGVFGDRGDDTITGDEGGDLLEGAEGCDRIGGEAGDDTLDGGPDSDGPLGCEEGGLDGGAGSDTILGGLGLDSILGGTGNDTIDGGWDHDTIEGGSDADVVEGGQGVDTILGQGGNDELRGGSDSDRISGGEGCDAVLGEEGDDIVDAGGGNDSRPGAGCRFASGLTGGVAGGEGNDVVEGGSGADWLQGNAGCDRLVGGSGNASDTLSGGDDDDHPDSCAGGGVFGDDGSDVLDGDAGADLVEGGAGSDLIDGGAGADELHGGPGRDTIDGDGTGAAGRDRIFGDDGGDTITGGDEPSQACLSGDVIFGGDERDIIHAGGGGDAIVGGDGADDLFGEAGCDDLFGGPGGDLLDGGDNPDGTIELLWGEEGRDTIRGGFGSDALQGGAAYDDLDGGPGADTLDGGVEQGGPVVPGPGEIVVTYEEATPGAWNDTVDGGFDADTCAYRDDPGALDDTLISCDPTPIRGNLLWEVFFLRGKPQP